MTKQFLILGLVASWAGACSVDHRTVVIASDDACARYGFTASTADYVRCQERIADERRAGRAAAGYDEARVIADSKAACASYGVPRGTANFDRCVQDEFTARRST